MPLVGERCRWSALDLFEEIDRPPLSVDRRHFFGSSHGYYTQLAFRPDSPHVARSPSSSSRTDSAEGRLAAAPPRSIVGYTRPTTNVRPIPQRHQPSRAHSTDLDPSPHRHHRLGRGSTSDIINAFCCSFHSAPSFHISPVILGYPPPLRDSLNFLLASLPGLEGHTR